MSSDNIAIRVSHLSKQYRLGGHQEPYQTFRDAIVNSLKTPLKFFNKASANEGFWALKNVSFDVKQGEVLGIIGRNGAGKSTLLKILSRITAPTEGTVELRGRVGSLLEVGTGFHPEMTGRENVFLNGSILGMKRTDIDQKLEDIVKFAEIDKFIDTPVKRYSSGMYVRLAFAVAAHLEPEILMIDEVLAVGDAGFQKKCLGKMGDVAKEGRTVLFVSHNMAAIESLCSNSMIISQGKCSDIGPTRQIIQEYLAQVNTEQDLPVMERKDRDGRGMIKLKEIAILNNDKNISNQYTIGSDIFIRLKLKNSYSNIVTIRLALSVHTIVNSFAEQVLISCDSGLKGETFTVPATSESVIVCRIISPPLNYGDYYINVAIFYGNEPEDWIRSAGKFSIVSGVFDDHILQSPYPVLSRFVWTMEK